MSSDVFPLYFSTQGGHCINEGTRQRRLTGERRTAKTKASPLIPCEGFLRVILPPQEPGDPRRPCLPLLCLNHPGGGSMRYVANSPSPWPVSQWTVPFNFQHAFCNSICPHLEKRAYITIMRMWLHENQHGNQYLLSQSNPKQKHIIMATENV